MGRRHIVDISDSEQRIVGLQVLIQKTREREVALFQCVIRARAQLKRLVGNRQSEQARVELVFDAGVTAGTGVATGASGLVVAAHPDVPEQRLAQLDGRRLVNNEFVQNSRRRSGYRNGSQIQGTQWGDCIRCLCREQYEAQGASHQQGNFDQHTAGKSSLGSTTAERMTHGV